MSAQQIGIKTNILYDASATINMGGGEFALAPKWTLDISGNWNGWNFKDNMKWMPMCGYWIGDVTADLSLSVILSRMMTRINLVINNNTGQSLSGIRAELGHIPAKAYVYPQARQEALPADAYLDEAFTDEDTGTIADGESWLLYHYIAPNICSGAENATTLKITSGGMEWNVALGNNSPSSSQRNYTLYANNYYTFTLNLGQEQRMTAGEDSVKYSELKRETVKGKGL